MSKRRELRAQEPSFQNEAFRVILDSVPDIVWYKDTENRMLWANRSALVSSGLEPKQVLGKSLYDLSPREAARYHEDDREVLRTGSPKVGIVQRQRTVPGRKRWVRTTKFPRFDDSGEACGIIVVSRDITEQKNAEQALRASEQRYHILTEFSEAGVFRLKSSGEVIHVSERWCEITALTVGEAAGKGWLETVHPDDRQELLKDLKRAARAGEVPFRARFRLCRRGGATQRVLLQAVAEPSAEEAEIDEFICTLTEVSAAEEVEDALREQRELYDKLATAAPIGIFHVDPSLRLTYMNEEWCHLAGLDPKAALGHGWFNAVPPEDLEAIQHQHERVKDQKRSDSVEFRFRRSDGTFRWVLGQNIPILGEDGEIEGYIGTAIDVTERRQAEQQIRDLNDELESRVAARSAELKAANEELEAFCYCVSHDLRSPLRTLDGFSYALLEDFGEDCDSRASEWLRRIRTASQRMGGLIDDLLTLSRLNRGEIRHEPVDLGELAETVFAELQIAEPRRSVAFELEGGTSGIGDPALLRVVLQHLVGNAWKFTRRNEQAKIRFGSCGGGESGPTVFFVADDGVGFDNAYAEKLFAPFQRLDDSDEFAGSGVGLATVERIVRRHGGRVWGEGRPGQGATFYFTLGG